MHLGMPPRPPSTWLGGKIRQETAVKKTPPLQNGSVKGRRGFGGAVFRKCTLTAPVTCYLDNLSFRKIQTSPHMLSYEAIPGGGGLQLYLPSALHLARLIIGPLRHRLRALFGLGNCARQRLVSPTPVYTNQTPPCTITEVQKRHGAPRSAITRLCGSTPNGGAPARHTQN